MHIRSRMKRNDDNSTSDTESQRKYHGLKNHGIIRFVSVVTFVVILLFTSSRWQKQTESFESSIAEQSRDWSHCIDILPQPSFNKKEDKRVEPLWIAAYPTSLPAKPYADVITALTGVKNGAKSYYRSSPTLKRCHGTSSNTNIQAVTCEIVHPIVPALRPHPSSQAANFGNVVLVALRNPLTAFPAFHQSKAELYHGQKGQVDKGDWIKFRDQYMGKGNDNSHLFNEWKNFIMEWRDMKPYYVGGYLPFEYWTDEAKGPKLVGKVFKILKEEGFPTHYDDTEESSNFRSDIECLWYRHVFAPMLDDEKSRAGWYVPNFTDDQKETLLGELDRFASEIEEMQINNGNSTRPGDEDLVAILRGYMQVIHPSK